MLSLRELEAQAKALAPVFSQLLAQSREAIRKEFQALLDERDQMIKSLKQDLESARVDEDSIVERILKGIPKPKDGEDGTSADMDALRAHLDALVKAIPLPENGKSITAEDVAPLIVEQVSKAIGEIPKPDVVKSVSPEEVAATFERRFSDLILSWERQARDTFDKAADRMPIPKDGRDGRDALPLESFDLSVSDDGRTVTVKMQAGEVIIQKSVKIAAVIDRGVYSTEKSAGYEKGDGATYGGCYWIAQKDGPEGVPGGSSDWRLAVKKGRDGKDGTNGRDLTKGVKIS